jgi:acyl carrier protein
MLDNTGQSAAHRPADHYYEALTQYLRSNVSPEFDPANDSLVDLLDSVGFLRLIVFIEEEFGIALDPVLLSLDTFADVGTVSTALAGFDLPQPEHGARA